jgi:hypothetical protein
MEIEIAVLVQAEEMPGDVTSIVTLQVAYVSWCSTAR